MSGGPQAKGKGKAVAKPKQKTATASKGKAAASKPPLANGKASGKKPTPGAHPAAYTI